MAPPKLNPEVMIRRDASQVDAVVDQFVPIARQQIETGEAAITIFAHADYFGERAIDQTHQQPLPNLSATDHMSRRTRGVIGEEHFLHRMKACEPGIHSEKAGEVQMQHLRLISFQDLRELFCRAETEFSR